MVSSDGPGHRPPGPLSALGIGVIAATVFVDQVSKAIAEARLPFGEAIDIFPFLALYRIHNTGIAFSLFAGYGSAVLIAVTLAVTLIVIAFWLRSREGGALASAGFALILGGAIGNLIDRVRLGHVIDFLLLHAGSRTLFVFNLADAALTIGPLFLLLAYMRPAKTPD